MRTLPSHIGLRVVVILGLVSVVACGAGESRDVTSRGAPRRPSALRSRAPLGSQAAKSPSVSLTADRPVVVSTSGALVVAEGYEGPDGGGGRVHREVRQLVRQTNRWSDLPDLPVGALAVGGAAIGDVPYIITQACGSADTAPGRIEETCPQVQVHRLVNGASAWETFTPPSDLFGPGTSLGNYGAVGDHRLGIVPAGSPKSSLVLLDGNTGQWSDVGYPKESPAPALAFCFSLGKVYARTVGPLQSSGSEGDPIPPDRYAFTIWGFDEQWSDPSTIDLGTVQPTTGGSSQLCAAGYFEANNRDPDGKAVSVGLVDNDLVIKSLDIKPIAAREPAPSYADPLVATTDDGLITLNKSGEVAPLPSAGPVDPRAIVAGSEWADAVDLLIEESAATSLVNVVSAPRP